MLHPNSRFKRADLLRFALLFFFLFAWGIAAKAADKKKVVQPTDADVGAPPTAPTYPSLKAEMEAHHLADDLLTARMRLAELDARRADAVTAARALVRGDHEGLALLRRYQKLLTARYADDEGAFQVGVEISGDDVTNLNQLFDHYLHQMPFAAQWGKISAGFARDAIKRGINQLDELASTHEDPSASNNAELEILAYQMSNAKDAIDRILDVADSRGIKLDPKAPLPENARVPAASE